MEPGTVTRALWRPLCLKSGSKRSRCGWSECPFYLFILISREDGLRVAEERALMSAFEVSTHHGSRSGRDVKWTVLEIPTLRRGEKETRDQWGAEVSLPRCEEIMTIGCCRSSGKETLELTWSYLRWNWRRWETPAWLVCMPIGLSDGCVHIIMSLIY